MKFGFASWEVSGKEKSGASFEDCILVPANETAEQVTARLQERYDKDYPFVASFTVRPDRTRLVNVNLCLEEIKLQAIRSQEDGTTMLKRYKAAQKYIKAIDDNRPGLKGAWPCEYAGKAGQGLCNGFSAVILHNQIPNLPRIFGEPVKVHQIMEHDDANYEEAEVSIPDMTVSIKAAGKDIKPVFQIGHQTFDPRIIMEVLPILGDDCRFLRIKDKENWAAPMFIKNDNGIAIVLPLRK